jgi:mannose-6-phosphate isomerase-like protein (cupin superfamily)
MGLRNPYTMGMSTYTYPHTSDNGAGERITFVRQVKDAAGERLEGEDLVEPGSGPPTHVHYHQEEGCEVRQGRLGYQRSGEPPRFAGPGETVVFGPGEAHKFWNAGEEDLRATGYIQPAGNAEFFLTALFESQRRNGGGRPDLFDAALLTRRYRSEFYMSEIPAVVQRFVFPVLVALGRVLGKYKSTPTRPNRSGGERAPETRFRVSLGGLPRTPAF